MNTIQAEHAVVSEAEWVKARQELLAREKAFTRAKDELAAARRELPWVRVEKEYLFDGPDGKVSLRDLFEHRSQLIVYHFMMGPDWEEGCSGCSFLMDHLDGALHHLPHHDVSVVVVSRAPLGNIEKFKKRMGWGFRWVSSLESDFNYDYHVSFRSEELERGPVFYNYKEQKLKGEEQPGLSVFYKDERGEIFHTYSTYERGMDILLGAYNYLEFTPKGRNEVNGMGDWMRLHDTY